MTSRCHTVWTSSSMGLYQWHITMTYDDWYHWKSSHCIWTHCGILVAEIRLWFSLSIIANWQRVKKKKSTLMTRLNRIRYNLTFFLNMTLTVRPTDRFIEIDPDHSPQWSFMQSTKSFMKSGSSQKVKLFRKLSHKKKIWKFCRLSFRADVKPCSNDS